MIITISGMPGSGKTTIAKLLAKKLNYDTFFPGLYRREIASKKGLSLKELNDSKTKGKEVDEVVDKKIQSLSHEKNIIIEGRMGFFFIPHSIKLFYDIDLKKAAKRIINQKRKSEKFRTETDAYIGLEKRALSDRERYFELYNIDAYNINNFDFVLNTTNLTKEQVFNKTLDFLKKIKD